MIYIYYYFIILCAMLLAKISTITTALYSYGKINYILRIKGWHVYTWNSYSFATI